MIRTQVSPSRQDYDSAKHPFTTHFSGGSFSAGSKMSGRIILGGHR